MFKLMSSFCHSVRCSVKASIRSDFFSKCHIRNFNSLKEPSQPSQNPLHKVASRYFRCHRCSKKTPQKKQFSAILGPGNCKWHEIEYMLSKHLCFTCEFIRLSHVRRTRTCLAVWCSSTKGGKDKPRFVESVHVWLTDKHFKMGF